MRRYDHWINGTLTPPTQGRYLATIDPMTEQPWAEIAHGCADDIDRAVRAASDAFRTWRSVSPSARADLLWRLGDAIAEAADELAALESQDAGKVIREVLGQIRGLRAWYRYYASCAYHAEGRQIPHDRQSLLVLTSREPYGVIGVIPPFNSPLLLASMVVGPALAAGNTVVVKPPEINALSLIRLAEIAADAGIPPGVINVVTGTGSETGDALVRHPQVRKVCFTGGPESARMVLTAAAPGLKPTTLELGGKSANIVFADVDVAHVVNGIIAGIFAAAGQTCVAGSRLLVHSTVADELISRIVERAGRVVLGRPTDPATEMGPMSQPRLRDGALTRIAAARQQGAEVLVGGAGAPVPDRGWFLAPTVVDGVTPDMAVVREEIFGPVLSVLRFTEEEEVIALANGTDYGLAAGIWTHDLGRAVRVARALEAGTVWINTYRALTYSVPFGGTKQSGFGRENGMDGFLEFTEPKAIWIESSTEQLGDPFTLRT
ncbi:MAG: aldehyde dehydrogenase [Actinomycetales bacterium]|nr:aldehyde dehydrogenase [Actinomycetales bacterium]